MALNRGFFRIFQHVFGGVMCHCWTSACSPPFIWPHGSNPWCLGHVPFINHLVPLHSSHIMTCLSQLWHKSFIFIAYLLPFPLPCSLVLSSFISFWFWFVSSSSHSYGPTRSSFKSYLSCIVAELAECYWFIVSPSMEGV